MPSSCWELQDEIASYRGDRPTLPEICARLHELHTGSRDSSSETDPDFDGKSVVILEMAVKDWEPSADHAKPYDDAVLALVKATLAERTN